MQPRLFFCFGPAKSGTTFLQRSLALHPQIWCPPEHKLRQLHHDLGEVLARYDRTLALFDRRTGGQGVAPLHPRLQDAVFRATVEAIVRDGAGDAPIAGLNDNGVLHALDAYQRLFDAPRLIAIFRHPLDTGISAWHHNQALLREEGDPVHARVLARHGDFAGWMRFVAGLFVRHAQSCVAFRARHRNLLIVRYEDLVHAKRETLDRLFAFLGADRDAAILDAVERDSGLEAMRDASTRPAFFREGATDAGAGELPETLRRELLDIAAPGLHALGYPLGDRLRLWVPRRPR